MEDDDNFCYSFDAQIKTKNSGGFGGRTGVINQLEDKRQRSNDRSSNGETQPSRKYIEVFEKESSLSSKASTKASKSKYILIKEKDIPSDDQNESKHSTQNQKHLQKEIDLTNDNMSIGTLNSKDIKFKEDPYPNKTLNIQKMIKMKKDKQTEELKQTMEGIIMTEIGSNDKCVSFVLPGQQQIQKQKKIPFSVYKPTSEIVMINNSKYKIRPQTIFFQYPSYTCKYKEEKGILKFKQESLGQNRQLQFKIAETCNIYNAVVNSLKRAGFEMVNGNEWNILWTNKVVIEDVIDLTRYQKINHFPGSSQLGRKDCLWRNVQRQQLKFGDDYHIAPLSFILPEEADKFQLERDTADQIKALWILKPSASSCGRGIKIIGPKTLINQGTNYVVSRYLSKPHLLNGFKYDLRIYVLVTSYDPMRVFIYKDGLVRFATEKYSNNPKHLKKRFMHLTNYSVNKNNTEYQTNKGNQDDINNLSSKWNFKTLKTAYEELGINYDVIFMRIQDVIIKTLISVEAQMVSNLQKGTKYKNTCFEVFGFDIMLDSKLKPWLLEVNVCPSLSSSSPYDKKVKTLMICDAFNIIGLQSFDRMEDEEGDQYETQQGEFPSYLDQWDEIMERDIHMFLDYEEEQTRSGCFEQVFPTCQNVDVYDKYFTKRRNNQLLWAYLRSGRPIQELLKQLD